MERKKERLGKKRLRMEGGTLDGRLKALGLTLLGGMDVGRCGAHPVADQAGMLGGVVAVVILMVEGMSLHPGHGEAGKGKIDQRDEEGRSFKEGVWFHRANY